MSIIQEALKKAQVEYQVKKTPKTNISFSRRRPMSKTRISKTISLILAITVFIAIVLVARMFLVYAPQSLVIKKSTPEPPAKIVAPESIVKSKEKLVVTPVAPALPPAPKFILNGIMYLENKPLAIINGYILEEGDSLNGATVLAIDKDYVLLNVKDDKVRLNLKYD